MKIKLSITNRWTGAIIFEFEKENNTIADTVNEYVRLAAEKSERANLTRANLTDADLTDANLTRADLTDANLTDADLTRANLTRADLTRANLTDADLTDANLTRANLTRADLTRANLTDADLETIKADMFYVLLCGKEEVPFLKQNLIDGKIDGSTYDGECACLSGTLENGAKFHNGKEEAVKIKSIHSCRNAYRPAERFFLAIRKGGTPETNKCAAVVLNWIEEFEMLMAR